MSDKVKLPKEVAGAIEELMNERFRPYQIVCMIHEGKSYDDRITVLRRYVLDNDNKLMQAIVNGYEVEQTPEDKVREYYQHHLEFSSEKHGYPGHGYKREAVIEVLDLLGIKISGVNAE